MQSTGCMCCLAPTRASGGHLMGKTLVKAPHRIPHHCSVIPIPWFDPCPWVSCVWLFC